MSDTPNKIVLKDVHKRFVTWQLLKALKFLHTAKLVHRDIKPSNLLLNFLAVTFIVEVDALPTRSNRSR